MFGQDRGRHKMQGRYCYGKAPVPNLIKENALFVSLILGFAVFVGVFNSLVVWHLGAHFRVWRSSLRPK